jgi:hypothetical protein
MYSRKPLIAAVALALVATPAALAFGSRLVDLFEGTPASPAVQGAYTTFNGRLTAAIERGFSSAQPADVSQIHGVIAVQTSKGDLLDLWSAPEQGGGACYLLELTKPVAPDTSFFPTSGCNPETPTNTPYSTNISYSRYWKLNGPLVISGYTYNNAASVEIDLADGSTLRLPVVERYFLAAIGPTGRLDPNGQVSQIISYDAQGNQVGEATG